MAETILSSNQVRILEAISRDKALCQKFYLTGGTALAEYYLQHRLSEDLDFFSEDEVDPQAIAIFFKKNSQQLKIRKIDFQQSFNRNLFFLHLTDKEVIKTEFTYFPFPRIETKKKVGKLAVDSLLDIAVNKVFTIYQQTRARDFIDLYFILQQEKFSLKDLVKKAKIKFDWHIDLLQFSSQLAQAPVAKDFPKMIKKIKPEVWQDFFIRQAKVLGKETLK